VSHANKVSELMTIRKDWTIQDFKDAYSDEWEQIPNTLEECHGQMEEYVYHTYSTEYIQECIDDEM